MTKERAGEERCVIGMWTRRRFPVSMWRAPLPPSATGGAAVGVKEWAYGVR